MDPDAGPCHADELRGEPPSWLVPGTGGEDVPRREPVKLIGFVRVTNTGERTCRLRGEVDARLRDRDGEVPIGYSNGVTDEAAERVTVVPPGESAELRLDWSAPFCTPTNGSLELAITLPEGGGTLRAPMTSDKVPPCGPTGETHPDNGSFLSTDVFDEPAEETVMDSPLGGLTAAVEPVATARPGELATFHVRLANPTGRAVPLDPCPGYYQERFSQGDATVEAINDGGPYRLNCRAVRSVPAHGSVRFAMGLHVPAELTPGRKLTVTWHLIAPQLAGEAKLNVSFTLTAT